MGKFYGFRKQTMLEIALEEREIYMDEKTGAYFCTECSYELDIYLDEVTDTLTISCRGGCHKEYEHWGIV